MNGYSEYSEQARLRYQSYLQQKNEKEEKERLEQEERERKMTKIEEDQTMIYKQLEEWDSSWKNGQDEPIFTLHLLYSILTDDFILLIKEYDRLDELQERVVRLVNDLNNQASLQKLSLESIREIYAVMKTVITKSETDISIEMMDTSGDADLCVRLQEEEEYIPYIQPVQENDEKDENLPLVSLSSRVTGMRLVELKALAKSHGFSCSGSKSELARMLEKEGLVRVVE
jgi:hypothetical protein